MIAANDPQSMDEDLDAQPAKQSTLSDVIVTAAVSVPFGVLWLSATPHGLSRVERVDEQAAPPDPRGADGAADMRAATEHLRIAVTEIRDYIAGRLSQFGVVLDLSGVDGFTRDVLNACRRIPYGRVATYSEVAAQTGRPAAARAVGNALHVNPVCIVVPCHRVVPRQGGLGGYGGGVAMKEHLLRLEGVVLL